MFGFSIKEILPHVYHLHFSSAYEAAMHFLRFQEFYESPRFHKRIFTLVDYMEWYSKKHGDGAFTYAKDWSGFNVPSRVLHAVRNEEFRDGIPDLNKYDRRMFALIDWVDEKEVSPELPDTVPHAYYFIGTSAEGRKGDEKEADLLDHEIAHALYTVDFKYAAEVNNLLAQWGHDSGHDGAELDSARDVLGTMGYHSSTIMDEIHAYCATGLCEELQGVISEREMKPFQRLFQEYQEKCKSEE